MFFTILSIFPVNCYASTKKTTGLKKIFFPFFITKKKLLIDSFIPTAMNFSTGTSFFTRCPATIYCFFIAMIAVTATMPQTSGSPRPGA